MITHELKVIERMSEGDGLSLEFEGLLIQGVSIDSRTVKPGNLFVPIVRELDGHNYVNEAISKGAIASFWQKDHSNPPDHLPLIYVDDCLEALQKLAAQFRRELQVKVIGVTGSNGKTTTKEMLNSVLQTKFRVYKTEGNLNSQVGVPLTVLGINKDAEIAIIEMGMSERGQIEQLSRITNPDIAVITMIGVSHLSSLGSREAIAAAKLEIVTGLKSGGCFVFNGDEPFFMGKIHHATKGYEWSNPAFKRQAWDQEVQFKAEKYLRPDDEMISILKERLTKLTSLPKSKDTYGLTHTDFHQSNFYLHNGDIYLFDLDDCSYTYFVNDIGITLCYALFFPYKEFENKTEYYRLFFRHFIKGYLKENTIQEEEIEYLQESIKLRYVLQYIYFHQANDVSNLDEESMNRLKEIQQIAASDEPMLPIDFVQEFKSIYNSIH